jgi:hypothetical protein
MPIPPIPRPPNFTPLMTPGPALDAWPPREPKPRDSYLVWASDNPSKQSVSWQTTAWGFGIPDIWDLIWYNFRTLDPRQVNFYMQRYVGCWQSNDGKNFSFKGAKPGIIYIPPLGFRRPTAHPLAPLVGLMLGAMLPHYPYISYKGIHVDKTYLLIVMERIRTGRIDIVRNQEILTRLGGNAAYDYSHNVLILPSSLPNNAKYRGTLAHEATHAILDLQKVKGWLRWENELLAQVVEAWCNLSVGYARSDTIITVAAEDLVRHIKAEPGKHFIQLEDYDRVLHGVPPRGTEPTHYNLMLRLKEVIRHFGNWRSWHEPEWHDGIPT